MNHKRLGIIISILAVFLSAAPALADAVPTPQSAANDVAAAQAQLKIIEARLQKLNDNSLELKAAVRRVDLARAAFAAAKAKILARLAWNSDYQSAVQQRTAAQQALDQARQSSDGSRDLIADLAQHAMAVRGAVTKMENDAMDADPAAAAAEKELEAA